MYFVCLLLVVVCLLSLLCTRSSLPELLEKKKRIDMHTNIATALLDHIKVLFHIKSLTSILTLLFLSQERKLDTFFETEEKMIIRATMVSWADHYYTFSLCLAHVCYSLHI